MTAFHNKSVLVLGGSRGIGAAIVRRFVADGASVVFSYSGSPQAAERLVQRPAARRCRRTAPIAMR
ncbi:oxidoreductase YjgI [Klebsiella pneumoniae]|uniref:Oxidoreductase YjgI n=1 Tax=Klebsiella pneumoniae TaxID=573 RepID=A0A377ZR31_KLEPN|nr:oxidoreductase YjgI [Klebsiella pneumoniae]